MKAETADVNERTQTIEIHVSMDVLKYPEVLPLTLRNIVVLLARRIPREDTETFKAYMSVVYELECTFASLND